MSNFSSEFGFKMKLYIHRFSIFCKIIISLIILFSFTSQPLQSTSRNYTPELNIDLADSLNLLDSLVDLYQTTNNRLALSLARRSLVVAQRLNLPEAILNAFMNMGNAYSQIAKDSSYIYYSKALQIADKNALPKRRPSIIYDIALLYNDAYNYKDALILLDSSAKLAEIDKNYKLLADIYKSIGNIKYDNRDYNGSLRMYQAAFNTAKEHLFYSSMGIAMGNLGRFEKDTIQRINIIKKAIGLLKKIPGNEREIANLMINAGCISRNPDTAIMYFRLALDFIRNGNDPIAEMGAYNNMAYSYLDKDDKLSAEKYLKDYAIPTAIKDSNKDWLSTLYDSYADVMKAQGKYAQEAQYRKKSLEYRSAADLEHASEQIRLLSSLLELKNKDHEILVKTNRLKVTRLWLSVSGLLIILSIFVILGLFQWNRIRLHKQRISAAGRIIELEENEKGRIARELHDITGQLVMGISGEIVNMDFPDPEKKSELLRKIEKTGDSLRAISHHMNKAMINRSDMNELVTGFCTEFYRLTGLQTDLDLPENEYRLAPEMVLHIYRIIQELLMNASKYCKGEYVRVRITVKNRKFILSYIDNGRGFNPEDVKNSGMGIMNIFERATLMGGTAILESSPGTGTSWIVTIPLPKN